MELSSLPLIIMIDAKSISSKVEHYQRNLKDIKRKKSVFHKGENTHSINYNKFSKKINQEVKHI